MADKTLSNPSDQPPLATSDNPTNESKSAKTSNRPLLVLVILIVIVVVIVGAYYAHRHRGTVYSTTTAPSTIAPAVVTISKTAFIPATISVKVNQAVVWTNTTYTPHIIASDPYPNDNSLPGLNSKTALSINNSYSYIFTKAGTYTYHDNLNPYTIKGTVIVRG